MDNTQSAWLSIKTVIRVRDFAASRKFYTEILGLPVIEEWDAPEGKGCVFAFGANEREGFLEIYGMTRLDPRHDSAFDKPLDNDKLDVQLGTDRLDEWAGKLTGRWPFHGPEKTPWGQRWIRLRDPDGLLIALYEGMDPGRRAPAGL